MKLADEFNKTIQEDYNELYVAINEHHTHNNKLITFKHYFYMKLIYLDRSDFIVIKKGTQAGATEWLIINAILKSASGRSVFYVLPTYELKNRFVKNRVDRSIEYTPYYKRLLKQKISRFSESTSLKHIGLGSIAFVGSNTPNAFTEYPADDLIIDEYDQCNQENLNMAWERLSASKDKRIIEVSNPTLVDFGIDREYNRSKRYEWLIKCEHCNEWQGLDFFKNVVKEIEEKEYIIRDKNWDRESNKDINLICVKCGKALDRFQMGEWIAHNRKANISGYHINKLFSTNVSIFEVLQRFEEGLKDESKLQRFYNGDLGVSYTASGSKINYDILNQCKGDYNMQDSSKNSCIIGIDVGDKLHTIIGEFNPDGRIKLIYINELHDYDDIKELYSRFNIKFGCVDALPETRLSKRLCTLKGMFRVFYGGKIKKETIDIKNRILTVDRTSSLDGVKESFLTQSILLPQNADRILPLNKDGVSEFYFEMCNATRIYDDKNKVYKWVEGSLPDHYMHAMNYMLISKKLLMKTS